MVPRRQAHTVGPEVSMQSIQQTLSSYSVPGTGLGDDKDRDGSTRRMGRWPRAHVVGRQVFMKHTNKCKTETVQSDTGGVPSVVGGGPEKQFEAVTIKLRALGWAEIKS